MRHSGKARRGCKKVDKLREAQKNLVRIQILQRQEKHIRRRWKLYKRISMLCTP
jgi:hypothetical protein